MRSLPRKRERCIELAARLGDDLNILASSI
jgi:hypothetical protein